MNKSIGTMIMATSLLLGACNPATDVNVKETGDKNLIGKSDIRIKDGRMTPEALWAMGRIGGMNVSPDGKRVVYTVAYYSVPENKSNREVFVMNADGSDNKQITKTGFAENEAVWIKGGTKIAFLCNESGSSQLWEMNPDGTDRKRLSDYDKDIEGFAFSPDEKKVLFISQVKTVNSTADKYPDLDKATGVIITDLMYKHWDEWVTTVPHPFVADFDGESISNPVDVMEGELFESPMKPFGGIEQLAWNTTSDKIAYTSRKKTGKEYAISTNSDIYVYDLNTKQTTNITEENKGYDTNPTYSPDGKSIAWLSMERDGYEADQNRLMVMNLETGEKTFVSKDFDSNVDSYCWSADCKRIYFTGVWHGESQVYQIDLANGNKITPLTEGMYDYASVALLGDKLIAQRHSMSMGDEIYSIDLTGDHTVTQLTFENKHIYDQLTMGKVEERWMKTTDGKQMLTWVIYPPQFDPNKKYPTLLFCEGGPQSPVSQFWSYRWNFQIMAANDYIIVAPNRRGLPGFGLEWNEAVSGDYGGQCMKDYFTAIDEVAKEPYVNKDRLGCVGASFGGFSVYWLAGHHDKRFKAFIAHDGIFNMEMQYLETEEMWFANWDMGGAYWEKQNATAQRTFANSPHKFVDKWDTPILCIHGEKDYRILANQGMAAFNAAVLRGVPAELLIYPDENHWVLKPQNGVLWQRTFFEWLDMWLKK
ncbi:alpha/beta hydrolase family protein [Parabacteroides distasonis]|jgi:putative peptidase|uniref:Dipeptidyl-peptidase 5 n=3 Tax=Parabacteroides distasonis TaxID=823 RepID=A6LC23_PARD8|nr:S9 family peptidase [Parabacteroides distasonis]MBP7311915.1 S9 family peptidase [Parabacteroides sp.]ABR43237.1 putative peptidase [Parabacteroides distasonis ATCC 8503]MBP8769325.1 S9 family peptidase [Parabacteroides sp.]MDB9181078.1 S9 family peptidase [Parabacteroides distasonis]MDB9217511.1 S9 family peptidase [Parabacteroides distasonis]